MNRRYQIFVSSTYKDLIDERQIAINVIMKLGHIPAGMELFSATGEDQFMTIQPIIDESDYYLIILSGKYGSVIKGENISYTEKEFDYAVSKGKRVIAFVRSDPDNLPSSLRETKPRMIMKFKKFRDKVLNNGMASLWDDKAKLAANLSTSITNVVTDFPAKTYWIHVNEDSIRTTDNSLNRAIEPKDILIPYLDSECFVYSTNVPENSLVINSADSTNKSLNLSVRFDIVPQNDYSDKFIGYCIKEVPNDWRGLIENKHVLSIHYEIDNDIDIWIEIKTPFIELYKKKFLLSGKNKLSIELDKYIDKKDKWIDISELCLVFRPYYERAANSNIRITYIGFDK